ncbi:hypothetical protein EJB05_51393, partial [Eragrostis curvula]
MGAAAKPLPLVCFKWPWSPNSQSAPSPSPSPCGDLELPWLFKSIRTLAQGLLIAGDLPSPASAGYGGGVRGRKRQTGVVAVEADHGDVEQRALAAALASGRPATVLEFYLPRCRLCASLQGLVAELEDSAGGSASFVLADAEDDRWLPERWGVVRQGVNAAKVDAGIGALCRHPHFASDKQESREPTCEALAYRSREAIAWRTTLSSAVVLHIGHRRRSHGQQDQSDAHCNNDSLLNQDGADGSH